MRRLLGFHLDDQRHARLKTVSLFGELSSREMAIVDGYLHKRHFRQHEVIFDEGDEGQAIYFILEGEVLICPQGQVDKPIAVLKRGEFFGELALLDDGRRVAQARAIADCELAVFFRGDFERLMGAHAVIASKLALQLARVIGKRLRGMHQATA